MLIIDGANYDNYIDIQTYSASKVDEYGGTEYQDGWWKKHRTVVRQRVSATIDLCFNSETDYNSFVSHMMETLGAEGDHNVTLYVNNTNTTETITAYVAWATRTALATKAFNNVPVFFRATLSIEER